MEGMGEKFISIKQKEDRKHVFTKEFYLAFLLLISTYSLLIGNTFSWVCIVGFVGSILIVFVLMILGRE